MSTYVLNVRQTLEVQDCVECGMQFGVPSDYDQRRRNDRATFYCPAGHPQQYTGPTEAQKLRKQAEQLERRLANEQEYARSLYAEKEAEKRAHATTKGQLTKTRKRAVNGVCPCCSRSFANVARHVKHVHPEAVEA